MYHKVVKRLYATNLLVFSLIFPPFSLLISPSFSLAQQPPLISKSPRNFNTVLTATASTYTFTIPKGTTRLSLTARGGFIKYAFNDSTLASYSTVQNADSYCAKDVQLSFGGVVDTLYMKGEANGVVAEIIVWK